MESVEQQTVLPRSTGYDAGCPANSAGRSRLIEKSVWVSEEQADEAEAAEWRRKADRIQEYRDCVWAVIRALMRDIDCREESPAYRLLEPKRFDEFKRLIRTGAPPEQIREFCQL